MKTYQMICKSLTCLTTALLLVDSIAPKSAAGTFIKADNTTSLSTTGSYTTGGVPGAGDTIQVDGTLSTGRTANLGGNLSISGINQTSADSANALTVGNTVGATLTIGSGGITKGGAAALNFNCAITLGAAQTWSIASSGTMQMNTTNFSDGGNALTISGAGTLDLRPASSVTYGANVSIGCGQLNVNSPTADVTLGGANSVKNFLINAGILEGSSFPGDTLSGTTSNFGNASSGTITLGGNGTSGTIVYNGNTASTPKTFTMDARNSGAETIKVSSSGQTLTLSAASLLYGSGSSQTADRSWNFGGAGNLTINSVIGNASGSSFKIGVVKNDGGTLTLAGVNTYTGGTVINAGTLKLSAGSLSNTAISFGGTGTLAVQPGSSTSINIGTTATAGAGATLNLGAQTFDMTDGAVSTCNLQQEGTFAGTALTVASGATFKFNLGNTSADLLAVSKSASVAGTVNVTIDTSDATSLAAGTYNLITASSGLNGGTWQFTGGGASKRVTVGGTIYNLTLQSSASAIQVKVDNTYTVTYNGNGNTGGSVPTDSASPYMSGATVTVLGNTGGLVKTGSTFNNWNTASGGGGTSYAAGDTFTISGNSTLYAQWQAASAIINTVGSLSALTTTYGTASAVQSVSVSGSGLTSDITATAPTGLEVSSDGTSYGATATLAQSGGSASGTLYVRLKSNATVSGTYNSISVVLSSTGATPVNVSTTGSGNSVSAKALTLSSAAAQSKAFDGTTAAVITGTLSGIVGVDNVTLNGTGTFASSAPGIAIAVTSTSTLGGTAAGNYSLTQPTGLTADIVGTPTWNTTSSGLWGTSSNWFDNIIGGGGGVTNDFSQQNITADVTVSLDSPRTIGTLLFGDTDTNSSAGWTIDNNGTPTNTITLAGSNPTITVNALGNGKNVIISAVVAGTGLAKTGAGSLTLSGTNTYSNGTAVNGGTLSVSSDSNLGSTPVSATPASLSINGGTLSASAGFALSANRGIALGPTNGNGSGEIDVAAGSTLVYGGIAANNGSGTGALVKGGSGALTLSGANTFSGGLTLSAGTIDINNASALGTVAGTFTVSGGTIDNTTAGSITTLNYLQTWNGDFTFTGSQNLNLGTGAVTPNGNRQLTISAGTMTIGGVIGGGAISLTKSGNGTLALSGSNTFSGGTTISAGSVIASSSSITSGTSVTSGALGTGNLMLNNGITLSGASGTRTIIAVPTNNLLGNITICTNTGSIEFEGVMDLGGASRTITLGHASADYASGHEVCRFGPASGFVTPSFQNAGMGGALIFTTSTGSSSTPSIARTLLPPVFSGNLGLTLDDGVAYSSGNGNVFAAGSNAPALTLNAPVSRGGGLLQLGDGISAGNAVVRSAEVYSLSGGGTVSSSNTTGNQTGGTLTINHGNGATFAGSITETGGTGKISVVKSGAGTQTFTGNNGYSGNTTISAGTLALSGAGSIANSKIISLGAGATFDLSSLNATFTLGGSQILSNSPGSTGIIIGDAATAGGTLSVSYTNSIPSFNVSGGTLILSGSTVFAVNNLGPALIPGTYKIISKSGTGSIGGTVPTAVSVANGPAAGTPSLSIVNGELYLTVGGNSAIGCTGASFTYNGAAQTPTIIFSGSTGARTTNYAGTGGTVYNSANAPTNAGSYYVSSTVAADANYFGATNTQSFTIGQAAATVTLGNLNPTYTGLAQSAGITTVPGGLTVNVTYAGSPNAPTNAGSYQVIGTVVDSNYSGSVTNTLIIGQAPLSVTANNATKECHQTLTFAGTEFTTSGLVANDGVSSVTLTSAGASSVSGLGSYSIVPASAVGIGLANYNIAYLNGTLTVQDTTAAVISYVFTNLNLSTTSSNCVAFMPDVTGTNYIIASDACSGLLIITQTPTNNAVLPLGTNIVVLAVDDGNGNTNYSTNTIVVADDTAPVITVLGANPVTAECHGGYADAGAIATDNCTLSSFTTNNTVDANSVGTYFVTYIATDAAGNSATNVRIVVVSDTTPPAVTLNGSSSMTIECHGTFTDPGATASDACAGSLSVNVSGSVDANSPGVYTLTYSAVDPSGNSNSVSRMVTVSDTTPPVVTLNGSSFMTVECHGTFTDPGASASDACAGSLSVNVTGSVNANSPGVYTLTYSAVDPTGNSNSVSRTVTVHDTTAPVISYYFTNLNLSVDTNCSALMPDVTGTDYIVATDACSGTNITITQTPTNNAVLSPGTNTVVIAVADQGGNTVYSTNSIVVADTTAPVITLLGFSPVTVECHDGYVDAGATASDNCTLSSFTTNNTVDANSVGTYFVTYIATDAAGNSSTNVRTVLVIDTTPPSIGWSQTSAVVSLGTNCTAILQDYTYVLTVTDACSSVTHIAQVPSPGTVMTAGFTDVTFYVDDGNGNTNSAVFRVTVVDSTSPVITSQPAGSTNNIGTTNVFSVTATSCSALTYQWYKGTNALSGQTNGSLAIGPIGSEDAGSYHVVVTSVAGSTTSQNAVLVVINEVPVIVSQTVDGSGNFQLEFSGPAGQTYRVLASVDASTELSGWSTVASGTFGSTNAAYTEVNAVANPQKFYTIESP